MTGPSLSRNTGGNGYEAVSGSLLAGYKMGIMAAIPLRKGGSSFVQTGLSLNQWGSGFPKSSIGRINAICESESCQSLPLQYVQIPVLLGGRFWLSPGTRVILGTGFYYAYRINNPSSVFILEQVNHHVRGALYQEEGTDGNYKRSDFGLSFNCIFEVQKNVNIIFQYDHGFRNIIADSDKTSLHNEGISLCLGFYINQSSLLTKKTKS